MRPIDADAIKLPKGFFENVDNVPKFYEWLNTIPTIDTVKHGKWKPFDLTWGRSVYACTSCGDAFEVPTEMGKPIYNYCPHCGVRMERSEE